MKSQRCHSWKPGPSNSTFGRVCSDCGLSEDFARDLPCEGARMGCKILGAAAKWCMIIGTILLLLHIFAIFDVLPLTQGEMTPLTKWLYSLDWRSNAPIWGYRLDPMSSFQSRAGTALLLLGILSALIKIFACRTKNNNMRTSAST